MAATGKTSLWLKPETYERWKASGRSLAELVERGLDADDYEAILRRVLAEMLEPVLRPSERKPATRPRGTPPVAAELAQERTRDQRDSGGGKPGKSPHRCPAKGWCETCGEWKGKRQ